jgi:hypothetical protein
MESDVKIKEEEQRRALLRRYLQAKTTNCAQIPQHYQMKLQRQEHTEQAQLIHDSKTHTYFNYHQLLPDPKLKNVWLHSSANEFGHLAQGVRGHIKGTDTVHFIHKDQVLVDRRKDVTYRSFDCEMRPNKAEAHCIRLTMGNDRINPATDMLLVKCHFNSIISTKGAICMNLVVKDFYLNTPMA